MNFGWATADDWWEIELKRKDSWFVAKMLFKNTKKKNLDFFLNIEQRTLFWFLT